MERKIRLALARCASTEDHQPPFPTQPALFMSASAAIADPLLRRAFGRRARPSDLHRTARVRLRSLGLRAPVSRRGSAISRRTVMNNEG